MWFNTIKCDWCGMDVYYKKKETTGEVELKRHKYDKNPLLQCYHKHHKDKDNRRFEEVTTV